MLQRSVMLGIQQQPKIVIHNFTDTKMVQLQFTPAPYWQESLWTEYSEYATHRHAVSLLSSFYCTASQHAGHAEMCVVLAHFKDCFPCYHCFRIFKSL